MRQRRNLLGGIIAVSIAAILLLIALEVLPAGLEDIFTRSWAGLLVLVGLSVLLRNRLPLGGLISIVVSVLLIAGIAFVAYSTRASQQRIENIQSINQTVNSGISLLQVNLETLTTEVEIGRSDTGRAITGEFSGSQQSIVEVDYIEDNSGRATLTVRESKPESFPPLESVGRGVLTLSLPGDVALDIAFSGGSGNATLNLSGMELERLNVDLRQGDALVTMPEYEPRSEAAREQQGTLTVYNGDLTLVIPEAVAARLPLDRGSSGIEPLFDSTLYDYISGVLLENRNLASADLVIRYNVIVPNGLIQVETTP